MKLLEKLTINSKFGDKYIEIYHGDLTNMPPEQAIDVLVVSAFPDNYIPTPGSLVGSLYKKGISVSELAKNKAFDLRQNFSCWMSHEVTSLNSGIQFKKILCFEPLMKGKPEELVGDIFQSLMPFINANLSINSIAMPIVATGNMGRSLTDMLDALFDAATHWLELGLPLKVLKIVEYSELKAAELKGAFSIYKKRYLTSFKDKKETSENANELEDFDYDIFISYSHKNTEEVLFIIKELQKSQPQLRIFLDRTELKAGAAWQQEIYEALEKCRFVMTLYSPDYLASKVCKEEFNIALFRHRDSEKAILIPIYLYTTKLPIYMKLINYIDCREGNQEQLKVACQQIISQLEK